jgi:acyl dehydratase
VVNYLEDYVVGQTFSSGTARIEADCMTSFAAEFDPQPFHLSDQGARNTIFGALAASGWYTAATSSACGARSWKCGRRSRGAIKG